MAEHDDNDTTYTVKEVIQDLKGDLVHRFDKIDDRLVAQDDVMSDIKRDIANTATKADVAAVHKRIDALDGDLSPRVQRLEDHQVHRGRVWAVVGSVALIIATVAGVVFH